MATEKTESRKSPAEAIHDTRLELRKVHWPNRKELFNYTWIVISTVLLMGFVIYLIDSGLGFIVEKIIAL